jgi:hypothetical protein
MKHQIVLTEKDIQEAIESYLLDRFAGKRYTVMLRFFSVSQGMDEHQVPTVEAIATKLEP